MSDECDFFKKVALLSLLASFLITIHGLPTSTPPLETIVQTDENAQIEIGDSNELDKPEQTSPELDLNQTQSTDPFQSVPETVQEGLTASDNSTSPLIDTVTLITDVPSAENSTQNADTSKVTSSDELNEEEPITVVSDSTGGDETSPSPSTLVSEPLFEVPSDKPEVHESVTSPDYVIIEERFSLIPEVVSTQNTTTTTGVDQSDVVGETSIGTPQTLIKPVSGEKTAEEGEITGVSGDGQPGAAFGLRCSMYSTFVLTSLVTLLK